MSKIDHQLYDITLREIDKALIESKKQEEPRNYLGMSQIGAECQRQLFYSFRGAEIRDETPEGIRRIEDGHTQEAIMAARLRMVPGIELITHDPDDPEKQIGFILLSGHFRGHCDGVIRGVLEAPGTWHTWEHKSVNEKSFSDLKKLREEKGEKNALREWNGTYYAQAQIYMDQMELTRHFLTVTTPGGRDYLSVRTEYNRREAEAIIARAKEIIFDNWITPPRISDKREYYKCKWCEFQEICHDGRFPLVNCKTCRYSEPVDGGERKCLLHDNIISADILFVGCNDHLYNPALISSKLIDQKNDCVIYSEGKITYANTGLSGFPELDKKIDAIYTSKELQDKIKYASGIKVESPKTVLNGEDVTKTAKKWNQVNKIDERLKGL